jgi:Superinfection immunity protein
MTTGPQRRPQKERLTTMTDYALGFSPLLMPLVYGLSVPLLFLYFVPALVAWYRGHRQTPAITVLNLLAGWTFVGWLIAMVWSCTRPANATTQVP